MKPKIENLLKPKIFFIVFFLPIVYKPGQVCRAYRHAIYKHIKAWYNCIEIKQYEDKSISFHFRVVQPGDKSLSQATLNIVIAVGGEIIVPTLYP